YINKLSSLFILISKVIKHGKYFILNVMDLRKEDKFYPVHVDIIKALRDVYYLDDIIIWDRRSEYSNLRPIGYPYKFRVNKIHEFLLVFINLK
ncbi:MAG: DNA methyltransferase, partial [bacterium]